MLNRVNKEVGWIYINELGQYAVSRAIETHVGVKTSVTWVNDINQAEIFPHVFAGKWIPELSGKQCLPARATREVTIMSVSEKESCLHD